MGKVTRADVNKVMAVVLSERTRCLNNEPIQNYDTFYEGPRTVNKMKRLIPKGVYAS